MTERRLKRRKLCSDLVAIQVQTGAGRGRKITAVLEDISESGAGLLLERPVPKDAEVRLLCAACELRGHVRHCHLQKGVGYYAGVEFDPGTEWSEARYEPQHLLDPPIAFGPPQGETERTRPCCNEAVCPREEISRVIEPSAPAAESARKAGAFVAGVCADLDAEKLARCFSRLFGIGPECRLFEEFSLAYGSRGRRPRKPADAARAEDTAGRE